MLCVWWWIPTKAEGQLQLGEDCWVALATSSSTRFGRMPTPYWRSLTSAVEIRDRQGSWSGATIHSDYVTMMTWSTPLTQHQVHLWRGGGQTDPIFGYSLGLPEDGSVKLLVYRKKTHTDGDQYVNFSSHHPLNHKLAVIRTLLERCYSIVSEDDDQNKEEEHVAASPNICGYLSWTIDKVKRDIVEK